MSGFLIPVLRELISTLPHQPIYKITKRLTSYQFLIGFQVNDRDYIPESHPTDLTGIRITNSNSIKEQNEL